MRRTLPAELMDATAALQAIIITAQVGSNNQLTILVVSNIYMYCDLHCSFMLRFNNSGSLDNVDDVTGTFNLQTTCCGKLPFT